MFDRLKSLLNGESLVEDRQDTLQLAAAALLVEAAHMDDHFDNVERQTIETLVQHRFDLDEAAARQLVEQAEARIKQSAELYGFTRNLKNAFDADERIEMMEMLWEVIYSDGKLDNLEASLMRRLAGLLYVSDQDSGKARKRALKKLGLDSDA